jgi:hypothetical protein
VTRHWRSTFETAPPPLAISAQCLLHVITERLPNEVGLAFHIVGRGEGGEFGFQLIAEIKPESLSFAL